MGYFNVCTSEVWRPLDHFDAHIRRRLRAVIVRQKKRPRFLYRALRRGGLSHASAKRTAYSRRGPWWQSNARGMQLVYSNGWFESHLV